MERINSTPEAKNLGTNALTGDIYGKYFWFSQISLSCKLKFLKIHYFWEILYTGIVSSESTVESSWVKPRGTPHNTHPMVHWDWSSGRGNPSTPTGVVSRVGVFLRNFSESAIFEKLIPKNSSRDFRHSTVFLVACQSAPSMVLEGQKQRTMLHSVALHMDFSYFWEILLFLRNSLLPRYNTT